jgi:hypothetical protein
MSYGLNVFNTNGSLGYSTDDVTWNQVDIFYVPPNGSVTNDYPVLSGKEGRAIQVLINAPALDRKSIAHTLTVNGTTVTASGGSEAAYILVLMR